MPRRPHEQPQTAPFLRSIHIQLDAEDGSRIQHFHPTAKSIPLLRSILAESEERAVFVVAPYGSGKSLTAAYALHLIENRRESREGLRSIGRRLQSVSPDLAEFGQRRMRSSSKRGIVLALHGRVDSLGEALKEAALQSFSRLRLGREAHPLRALPTGTAKQTLKFLYALTDKCRQVKMDRISILWDEFGRHLEALLASGRASDLGDIQSLAEFTSRSDSPPMSLALLLHRGLLQYADNLPHSARLEWAKIEGRFKTIQYVDDSKEIYRLIRDVVTARRDGLEPAVSRKETTTLARACRQAAIFSLFKQRELADLIRDSYPIEPLTLYLLPRVSARVAQNERTLFDFLQAIDVGDAIGPDRLYDYFESNMRADTAVGGTYKQWVETASALSKVGDDELTTRSLKAACLLSLGSGGERARARLDALRLAVVGYDDPKSADRSIQELIRAKLLLHRAHNDDVAVWHGTDVDLRGRLEQEKNRRRHSFDLIKFLRQACPPPVWRSVEYNDEFGVRRSFTGDYQDAPLLTDFLDLPPVDQGLSDDVDGLVVYLPAETHEQLEEVAHVAIDRESDPRMLIVVPREPLRLRDAALDVQCLMELQRDTELLSTDPLIATELRQMTDDARAHLQRLVDCLTRPSLNGSRWFNQGQELSVLNAKALRRELSRIAEEVFPSTPKIHNEMIVRRTPSPIVINSRKKFLIAVLERAGEQNLGIEGNFPDASIFRTVLLHTGLYRKGKAGRWSFASPTQVSDKGLAEVWDKIREFLTEPSEEPKKPAALIKVLKAPPFGVRAGLIPVLLGSGLQAFQSVRSLTRDGEYLTDLLPSDIESLCREPHRYRLRVLNLDEERVTYLRQLRQLFGPPCADTGPETDLIRLCYDAVEAWKAQLPPAALESENVSSRARALQQALKDIGDPIRTLFTTLPAAVDSSMEKPKQVLTRVQAVRDELLAVVDRYVESALASVARVIPNDQPDMTAPVAARRWSTLFPDDFVEDLSDGVAKGLLLRMRTEYESDRALIDSLSQLLVGRSLDRWDERSLAYFDRQLAETVQRVEERALSEADSTSSSAARDCVEQLIASRLGSLYTRLRDLVGDERARQQMSDLVETSNHQENRWQVSAKP